MELVVLGCSGSVEGPDSAASGYIVRDTTTATTDHLLLDCGPGVLSAMQRIEDIDPPREMPGAADLILTTLEAHGLGWDGEVMFQSARHGRYDEIIDQLYRAGDLYWCRCTRREIMAAGGFYNGHCRTLGLTAEGCAARLRQHHPVYRFEDALQGEITVPAALAEEDFIVRRRDGLYAYNLAVVVDDMDSGITGSATRDSMTMKIPVNTTAIAISPKICAEAQS